MTVEPRVPESLPVELEELLRHRAWLRNLARGLVRDQATADDLVQDAFVVALDRSPQNPGALRSWLAAILRRAALQRFRGEERRRRREVGRDEPRPTPAAEETVARFELQRLLAEEVARLPASCRTTLLLHYFEGLSSSEIARQQGVAASSVRWRLQKALKLLREGLDGRHGGCRDTWRLSFAPLLALPIPQGAESGGVAGGSMIALKIVAGLAACSVVGLGGYVMTSGSTEPLARVAPGPEEETHSTDDAEEPIEAPAPVDEPGVSPPPEEREIPIEQPTAFPETIPLVDLDRWPLELVLQPMTADEMIVIPAGEFPYGFTRKELKAFVTRMLGPGRKPKPLMERSLVLEKPRTEWVAEFAIDRHEVTNEEYLQFVKATGHAAPPQWKNGIHLPGEDAHPVMNVSFGDAEAYARWVGKRLPTEFEWEKAARGTDGRAFPWGDEWDRTRCNNALQRPHAAAPVGTFPAGASPFGVLDMAGNVWEWTSTYITPYPGNKNHPSFNSARGNVIRGGCYLNTTHELSSVIRNAAPAENRFEAVGFRCVRTPIVGADLMEWWLRQLDPERELELDRDAVLGLPIPLTRNLDDGLRRTREIAVQPVSGPPFFGDHGKLVGVLATEVPIAEPELVAGVYSIFSEPSGRGTVRVHLVDADGARTSSSLRSIHSGVDSSRLELWTREGREPGGVLLWLALPDRSEAGIRIDLRIDGMDPSLLEETGR